MGFLTGEFQIPLSGWGEGVFPLEQGGLGIRKIVPFNQALLGKWLWRYGHEPTHLWRRVIACNEIWGGERGAEH